MNPRLFDPYDTSEREHFRHRNLHGHGRLTLVDDSGPVQQFQYEGHTTELRDAQHFGTHGLVSVPLPNSSAVTLHQGGHRGFNTVVSVLDGRYRPTGHKPGEVALWMVDGAGNDGTGGTVWQSLQGLMGAVCKLFGKTMVIGDAENTTTIDVYGKTQITLHTPKCTVTNGGSPIAVKRSDDSASAVLFAD